MANLTQKTSFLLKKALIALQNKHGLIKCVDKTPFKEIGNGIRKGREYKVRLPHRVIAADGPVANKQPIIDRYTNVEINFDKNIVFNEELLEKTVDIDQFYSDYIQPAAYQLGADADHALAKEGMLAPGFVGVPGTASNVDVMRHASALMTDLAVPDERKASVTPSVIEAVGDQIQTYNMSNAKTAVVSNYRGNVASFSVIETANMGTQKTGGHGAAGAITYASHVVDGQTNTCTMTLGAALPGKLFAGQNFTIPGVNYVNPITRDSIGVLAQFSLLVDAPAGATTIQLTTDINDGSTETTKLDGTVVSMAAYQNVTAAPVAGAPLQFVGAENMEYAYSLLFHKTALRFHPVTLEKSKAYSFMNTESDPTTGLSMSYIEYGDGDNREVNQRIDMVASIKLVRPEFVFKMYS